ncbi:MAG: secretion system protein E, partial [Chloroflexi bacterium]|nr:secretion system protein E [Chloroflexota bacterium]
MDCPTYRILPPALQEKCQQSLHLLQYLHALPMDEIGIPECYETLTRSLRGARNPNLIYPLGGGLFVHILTNSEDIRNHYIPIEPSFCGDLDGILEKVEIGLAEKVGDDDMVDEGERVQLVMEQMDSLLVVGNNGREAAQNHTGLLGRSWHKANGGANTRGRIHLTAAQYSGIRYLMKRKLEGMGLLEPMIRDEYIEDISCSGLGNIFVEHKIFSGLRTSIVFETHEALDKFVVELAETIRHPVTFRDPCVDASLPDGSRINIVYGTDVSKRGSNFTIRKFSPVPMSIIELMQLGTLNAEMAAYLSLVIQDGMIKFVNAAGERLIGYTQEEPVSRAFIEFIHP